MAKAEKDPGKNGFTKENPTNETGSRTELKTLLGLIISAGAEDFIMEYLLRINLEHSLLAAHARIDAALKRNFPRAAAVFQGTKIPARIGAKINNVGAEVQNSVAAVTIHEAGKTNWKFNLIPSVAPELIEVGVIATSSRVFSKGIDTAGYMIRFMRQLETIPERMDVYATKKIDQINSRLNNTKANLEDAFVGDFERVYRFIIGVPQKQTNLN